MKRLIRALFVGLLTTPLLLLLHTAYIYSDSQSNVINDRTFNMPPIMSKGVTVFEKSQLLYDANSRTSLISITKSDMEEVLSNDLHTEEIPVVIKPPAVVPKLAVDCTHTLYRYTVCSSYWEQQSNAILNLFSLQRWANSLGMTVVEPFVYQSELKFPPEVLHNNTLANTLRLRDYIDLKYWDYHAKEAGVPPLETWEDFVLYSAKKIILVILPYSGAGGTFANNEIKNHPQCDKAMSTFFDKHGKLFHFLQFEVIRNVCISFNQYVIPSETFNSGLQTEDNKGVTVWITEWQGVGPGRVVFTGLKNNKFGRVVGGEYHYLAMIKPSSRLVSDSRKYIHQVLGVKLHQFDAVVARNKPLGDGRTIEWQIQHFNRCVSQLEKYTEVVKNKMFLAIDMGKFGDRVLADKFDYNSQGKYTGNGQYLYKRYLSIVYGNKSIDSYENDFVRVTNGIVDTGYIGALQRTIALHANHVFLVGGHSSFQKIIIKHFFDQKKHSSITKLCF